MTWQPIATAPTDYTEVIGMDARGTIARTWFFAPSSHTREWLRVGLPGRQKWNPIWWMPIPAPGGEAAQAAETCKCSAEGEHPVTEGEAPDQISTLKAEPTEQTIARLTRERDDARTALAESERKRVEAEANAENLRNVLQKAKEAGHAPWTGYTTHPVPIDSEEIINLRNCLGIICLGLATPTQETPHVES